MPPTRRPAGTALLLALISPAAIGKPLGGTLQRTAGPLASHRMTMTKPDQDFVHPHLAAGKGLHGNGVFAQRDLPSGTVLAVFSGKTLGRSEALALEQEDNYGEWEITQIGPESFLVERWAETGIPSYFNHSCAPNAGFDPTSPRADTLVSLRLIRKGEEVTYHYGTGEIDLTYEFKPCLCGAPTCQGSWASKTTRDPAFLASHRTLIHPYVLRRARELATATP